MMPHLEEKLFCALKWRGSHAGSRKNTVSVAFVHHWQSVETNHFSTSVPEGLHISWQSKENCIAGGILNEFYCCGFILWFRIPELWNATFPLICMKNKSKWVSRSIQQAGERERLVFEILMIHFLMRISWCEYWVYSYKLQKVWTAYETMCQTNESRCSDIIICILVKTGNL